MEAKDKKIIGPYEKMALAIAGILAIFNFFFWDQVKQRPGYAVGLIAASIFVGFGFWVWKNFRLSSNRGIRLKKMVERLEGIIYTLLQPRGFDIITLPFTDDQDHCWAVLRDSAGAQVIVIYTEQDPGKLLKEDDLRRLIERMNVENAPKGIYLTTGFFEESVRELARTKNILLRDGDQLMDMIHRSEQGEQAEKDHYCRNCGTLLEPSAEITNLWVCPNESCLKTYHDEELVEGPGQEGGNKKTNVFYIDCYKCSRPVEIDTSMSGLMECPYDDCSWVINVDNELLALMGGLDKRASEKLAEIKCPRCSKTIKVPADADGLMECPCEEKWIIDVGAALGERAQAQMADEAASSIEVPEEKEEEEEEPIVVNSPYEIVGSALTIATRLVRQREKAAAGIQATEKSQAAESGQQDEELIDCPGCGAGIPKELDTCILCGTKIAVEGKVTQAEQAAKKRDGGTAGEVQVSHRHAYLSISTPGLMIFFVIVTSAFLAFVYFVAK